VYDGICLRLGRRDMKTFRTVEREGHLPVVHVAGRHAVALCPACAHPSVTTNGTGWRDVFDVVRTLVVVLSICVRRFVCENEACPQRTFDERFEGIGRGGASERALGWFADLARGRATAAVARDLGVPAHYLRLAVGQRRQRATAGRCGRLGRHLAIDECGIRKPFVYATVFSDPGRGVVIDVAPGRDAAAVWAFAGLFSRAERAQCRSCPWTATCRIATWSASSFPTLSSWLTRSICTAASSTRSARCAGRPLIASAAVVRAGPACPNKPASRWPAPATASRPTPAHEGPASEPRSPKCAGSTRPWPWPTSSKRRSGRSWPSERPAPPPPSKPAYPPSTSAAALRSSRRTSPSPTASGHGGPRSSTYARTGGASNGFAEAINHLIKNQKRQAHGYPSWTGFRGQILWCFGEAVDPETGEIVPLRSIPQGQGARYIQPRFA
jgi:hypothetical protein